MKREIIEVTAEDLRAGQPKDLFSCPIALALKRPSPGCFAAVGRGKLTRRESEGEGQGRFVHASPSERMLRFIRAFDKGRSVQPTRFRVLWEEER